MRVVGRLAADILAAIEPMVRPGVSTEEIDVEVDALTRAAGAVSAPMNYPYGGPNPFPKHCCTSVNEVVCHGIPDPNHLLREGDIVNVDVTPRLGGYHGDTSKTFLVGEVDPETRALVEDTFEAMRRGIAMVRPGNRLGDIGYAIQSFAESKGHSVVRQFAGHGIGKIFHGPPTISHTGLPGTGLELEPGMTFTIEPMINQGHWRCEVLPDHWTAITCDHSLSAQFEHTVVVTEDGVDVLTLRDGETFDLD